MKRSLLVLAFASAPSLTDALTVADYKPMRASNAPTIKASLETYFIGALESYGWANAWLRLHSRDPMYCPPPQLALNAENAMHFVDSIIDAKVIGTSPIAPDMAVDMLLLDTLTRQFPCPPSGGAPTKP